MHETKEPTTGSVPHHWGNALARRWAPELPRPLTGGFLTMLYALRTLASKDGYLRYDRDGKAITLSQIATACRCDVRDVRTYLSAALAAGVVAVDGARRRGVAALYVLLVSPRPNWVAAAAVVANGRRQKRNPEPAPWHEQANGEPSEGSGHRAPNSETESSGHRAPNLEEETKGHRAPTGLGAPRPYDMGAPRPQHPGSTHDYSHEMADVGPQVRDARGPESHDRADDPSPPPEPPHLRAVPEPPPGTRTPRPRSSVPDGQIPLLMPVHGPERPVDGPAPPEMPEPFIGAPQGGWRAFMADHAPDPTGT